jgi:hypothetical protein
MKIDIKNVKEYIKSPSFTKVLLVVGIIASVLIVFNAGFFVGFRKSSFLCGWSKNYSRNFGERLDFRMKGPDFIRDGKAPNSHGVIGKIISISLPEVVVSDNSGIEKIVVIDTDTKIMSFREEVKQENLKTDSFIMVIGSPNNESKIEAKLIRIMPPEPQDWGGMGGGMMRNR